LGILLAKKALPKPSWLIFECLNRIQIVS